MRLSLLLVGLVGAVLAQEPEFPLTVDSKVQEGVAKGTMVKGEYVAREGSVFPGTVREYQLYLPAGFDKAKPAAFMVFQDGVIYQAPVVFDNLIAKGDIPPLVGVFIKPGVVPAANENALPRFNRSFEYDSVTPTYSKFLIEEFLPTVEAEHGITFSTNPNEAAIAGNSSGGICAFMVAWHRPDRFRRVFTGVGTYVGIHGADQLPVWVRKFEPKPIRVFLQSGTGDNNLYCGDWWMANQMMERSLSWAGYEVNHAWGDGGHNQKHASQVFPDAMRWLWREWKTEIEVKANVKGESKWKGYEVVGEGEWESIGMFRRGEALIVRANIDGMVVTSGSAGTIHEVSKARTIKQVAQVTGEVRDLEATRGGKWLVIVESKEGRTISAWTADFQMKLESAELPEFDDITITYSGRGLLSLGVVSPMLPTGRSMPKIADVALEQLVLPYRLCVLPDQTQVVGLGRRGDISISSIADSEMSNNQEFYLLESFSNPSQTRSRPQVDGLCVDSNGWLYVATSLGIQVLDQAGRVNFIIPTPRPASDVCFGGKNMGELFIACGDVIYKRSTKAKGVVSGQMAPIKPAPPKL
jgi:enterochelin esterase-like enzyme